jgi:HPt (histidine-containing phosphotransfer) domain-containing protein
MPQAGMDDYLAKPFTPEDLYHKLFIELKIESEVPEKPVPANPPSRTVFDLNYLKKVSGGSDEFVNEMVQTFIHSIPLSLQKLEQCIREKDWRSVSRAVHQIKPTLTLLGIHSLKESAILIEEKCRHGEHTPEIQQKLDELIVTSKTAVEEMKQLL